MGLVAALLYPVLFEALPLDGVERTLQTVVGRGALGATPDDYRQAIRAALASPTDLAGLLPQPHSDATIRIYLAELGRRLDEGP